MSSQVWMKASYELTRSKDFSMAAVLAAMAVDCDLAFLFKKWTSIERGRNSQNNLTDEEYAEKLRKIGRIKDKFRAVSALLVPGGFEDFVNNTPKWSAAVDARPELDRTSLTDGIDKALFWPRNQILHGGKPVNEEEAKRSVQIARLCLEILLAMDYEKRKHLPRC